MNTKIAEVLLPCYRQGKDCDSKITKAVRFSENHDTLRRMLSDQLAFDEQMAKAIRFIKPPEDLRKKLADFTAQSGTGHRPSIRKQFFNPAVLAAALSILTIVGFFVYLKLEEQADFPGKDAVAKLLESTSRMDGAELEPTNLPTGQLGDAVYMRGFEGFTVPEEFASLPAVGWRVYRDAKGHRVAQLAVDRQNALIFVFRTTDFGIQLPERSDWRILTHEDWVGAVTRRGSLCTMVTFRGNKADMQNFLKPPNP